MTREDAFEREERILEDQLDRGELSPTEHRRELRELQRDYQAAAEEAAQRAYHDEMERW
jgi:hypothetical protein